MSKGPFKRCDNDTTTIDLGFIGLLGVLTWCDSENNLILECVRWTSVRVFTVAVASYEGDFRAYSHQAKVGAKAKRSKNKQKDQRINSKYHRKCSLSLGLNTVQD